MAVEFNDVESRAWLIGLLREGPFNITFTKADGSERVMKCSLKSDLIQEYERKTDKQRTVNEDILPVFDLEKQQWRSFRWDSIKRIEGLLV